MKKKWKLLACICLLLHSNTYAQEPDANFTDAYLLNFSVPDMPAFKALGTDPSHILRPSDLKKFGAMISPFYNGKQGVIPKNFALEVAPWKLASKDWTLQDYDKKKLLYHSGFSLGTIQDTAVYSSKVALGYRVNIVPKKYDIIKYATRRFAEVQGPWHVKLEALETAYNTLDSDKPASFDEFIKQLSKDADRYGEAARIAWQELEEQTGAAIPDSITSEQKLLVFYKTTVLDTIKTNFQKKYWNATRYDIAVAFVGESPDTFLARTQFSSFQFWGTAAFRLHEGGQLLLGTNVILPRTEAADTVTKFNFTVNARYYLGTSNFRGFLEGQYKHKNYDVLDKALLINLGAEFRLMNRFWVTASAGVDNYLDTPNPLNKLVSSVDIRYGFNEPARD